MTEQVEKRKGGGESRIPVLREVPLNRRWRKGPGALNGKAQWDSENELKSLEERLRRTECERDTLAQAFEALGNELARYKSDNEHLTATLATYEASVKDCKAGPALGSYEQEEDALIEQLVTAVIASQQRALLTQGCAAARSSCQETKCAEETYTEPSYFDTLVARNERATQDPLDGSLKDEVENLRIRLSFLVEKHAQQNDTLQAYQDRYHQCVERCSVLEAQVSRHSSLLGKLEVAMALKDKVLALFKENVSSLDHHTAQLSTDRETWIRQVTVLSQRTEDLTKECSELRVLWEGAKRDNEQLLRGYAHFLANWSVERALGRSHEEELEKLKAELNSKVSEVSDGKRKLARYHSVFKRSQQEYQETLEFSDAERNSLLLSIKEMEAQIQTLQQQMRGKEAVISTLKAAEVNARELRMSLQLSQQKNSMFDELEVSVRGAYQLFRGLLATIGGGEKMSRHPENSDQIESSNLGRHLMSVGIDMQRRLQHTSFQTVAVTTGNQGDHGEMCYEDLLRENAYLNERITELSHDLEKELEQSQVLQKYTEEYQSSASCKIAVLKENVAKADLEIAELDKLVDHVREVMRSDLELVKGSPQLLALLREIEGNEAPQNY
ncbi:hypothetical protein EMCRGX_G025056 [Ephydatia muelleri]